MEQAKIDQITKILEENGYKVEDVSDMFCEIIGIEFKDKKPGKKYCKLDTHRDKFYVKAIFKGRLNKEETEEYMKQIKEIYDLMNQLNEIVEG